MEVCDLCDKSVPEHNITVYVYVDKPHLRVCNLCVADSDIALIIESNPHKKYTNTEFRTAKILNLRRLTK